uniref:ANK_REP_REGION domain-containing protein n=1 Tax=Caenorhabditis tropicalis TaxID=1561998 RepID=A0A1I7T1X7_9PELO
MDEGPPVEENKEKGEDYRSVLYNAASIGNLTRIDQVFLIDKKGDHVFLDDCLNVGENNRLPLVIAARNGFADVVQRLLEYGAKPSVQGVVEFDNDSIQGTPPLWAAAAAGHLDIVKILVEKGNADVNQATNTQSTPLRGACYDGHLEIVKYLIEKGADPKIPNRHGHTCLMIAAYRNKLDVVKFLLTTGIDVNDRTERGNTALHDAAESGNVEVVKILLEKQAGMFKDKQGVDPLMCAALSGYKNVVEILANEMQSAVHKRDALKLLGCTYLDKKMDTVSAMACWREAMQVKLKTEELRLIREMETFFIPKEVYENQEEAQTLGQIEQLDGNIEALRNQALIIRERILGGAHTDVHYYLRFRGAVYCDMGQMNKCYDLWKHALELQQEHFAPLHYGTVATIQSFQETFSMSLNDYVNNHHANPNLRVKNSWIQYVFNQICGELERAGDWNQSTLLEDTDCCGHHICQHTTITGEYKKLVIVAIHLMNILDRLQLPSARRDVEGQKDPGVDLERLITICKKLHIPILHYSLEEKPLDNNTFELDLPKVTIVQQFLDRQFDVNVIDENGDTPMHLVLKASVFRRSLASVLLRHGAWIFARNGDDVVFNMLDALKRDPEINLADCRPEHYMTLAGLVCNAMRVKYNDLFVGVENGFPLELQRFYLAH